MPVSVEARELNLKYARATRELNLVPFAPEADCVTIRPPRPLGLLNLPIITLDLANMACYMAKMDFFQVEKSVANMNVAEFVCGRITFGRYCLWPIWYGSLTFTPGQLPSRHLPRTFTVKTKSSATYLAAILYST